MPITGFRAPAPPQAIPRGAEPPAFVSRPPRVDASNWRPVEKNTLRGFFSLTFFGGLTVHEFSLHQRGARWWVALPGRPQLSTDGQHRADPATGRKLYTPAVEIAAERREPFQAAALAAIDRLLKERP